MTTGADKPDNRRALEHFLGLLTEVRAGAALVRRGAAVRRIASRVQRHATPGEALRVRPRGIVADVRTVILFLVENR
jgi:hypothetical protein